MPHDWLKKLAQLFHPISSKTIPNRDALSLVFPPFASAACNHSEFWLVHWIVRVLWDWLERLLWIYDAQLKTSHLFYANDVRGSPCIYHCYVTYSQTITAYYFFNRCDVSLFWIGKFFLGNVFYSQHLCSNRPEQTSRLQTPNQISPFTVSSVLVGARDHCGWLSLYRAPWVQVSLCRSLGCRLWKPSNGLLCCHATYADLAGSVTVLVMVYCVEYQKGNKRV